MIFKRLTARRYHHAMFLRNRGKSARTTWTKILFGSRRVNSIYSITNKGLVDSWLSKWKLAGI